MQPILLIPALDEWFSKMNLPILSTVIDILLILLIQLIVMRLSIKGIRYVFGRRSQLMQGTIGRRLMTLSSLLCTLIRFICIFVAAAMILGELGLKNAMTSMLAAAGIGGIALGIGAQSLIGDVSAGLFMLLENELDVGDYVQLADAEGTVEAVSLRTTSIRGQRGELHIVHNGQIKSVVNYSRGNYLALVDVSVAYEADVARAKTIMQEEAEGYAKRTENQNKPQIYGVTSLDASGITLRVGLFVPPAERWSAERTLRESIKGRFCSEGIEIPYDKLVVISEKSK